MLGAVSGATLNRLGIFLNVLAGILLTPQLLGTRRLEALERWAGNSSKRLRDSIERWRTRRNATEWTTFGDQGKRQEVLFAGFALLLLVAWSGLIAAARDLRGGSVDWSAPWLTPLQGGAQPWDGLLVGFAGVVAFAAITGFPRLSALMFGRAVPRASLDAKSHIWDERPLDKVAVLAVLVAWAPALLVMQSYYALLFVGWGVLNRVIVPASHRTAAALTRTGGLADLVTTAGIALFIVGNAAQFVAAD
jgi:hypothetical protein